MRRILNSVANCQQKQKKLNRFNNHEFRDCTKESVCGRMTSIYWEFVDNIELSVFVHLVLRQTMKTDYTVRFE